MVGIKLAVSTALVASSTVSGFLIPPTSLTATEPGTGESVTLNILPETVGHKNSGVSGKELSNRIVRLPCADCAPHKSGETQLLFNFSIPSSDRDTLFFNDVVLYPEAETHELSATLIPAEESIDTFQATKDDHSSIPIELRGPSMVRDTELNVANGMELLEMTYGVVALRHGRHLHNSKIQVILLRDGAGKLSIIRASAFSIDENGMAVPVSGPTTAAAGGGLPDFVKTGCKDVMCGARERIAAKYEELKIAMMKSKAELKHSLQEVKAGHIPIIEAMEKGKKPLFETIEHGKHHLLKKPCDKHEGLRPLQVSDEGHFPTHFGFHPTGGDESNLAPPPTEELEGVTLHKPHHHHGGHRDKHHFFQNSRMHRFRANAAAVVLHIFVPIIFGVLIGLATYAIGVFVGCGIVWLWVHVVRRGKKNKSQYEELPTYDSDEECYLDSPKTPTEAPPAYVERASQEALLEKESKADHEE